MSCYQEEIIQAAVRHLSSVSQDMHSASLGFSNRNLSIEYGRSFDEERRAYQDIKDAAVMAYLEFCAHSYQFTLDTNCQRLLRTVSAQFIQWRNGLIDLSMLVVSLNDALRHPALQSEVSLVQRFISVHNIFSLLQLKHLQLQAMRGGAE